MKWCAVYVVVPEGSDTVEGTALYGIGYEGYESNRIHALAYLSQAAHEGLAFVCAHASQAIRALWWPSNEDVAVTEYDGRFSSGLWRYDRKRKAAEIWDIRMMLGVRSLDQLADQMNVRLPTTPQKLRGVDPDKYEWICSKHQVWECIECYAIARAQLMYRSISSLSETLAGWGIEPRRSAASTSVSAWVALDRPEPCAIHNPKIRKLAREAYTAGRVEAYKLGHLPQVWVADMRSAYGWAEQNVPMPNPDAMIYATHVGVDGKWLHYEGVVNARIRVPYSYVPPLPLTQGKRRLYPCGEFEGCWTIGELRYAVSLGTKILSVERVAFSHGNLSPFSQFTNVAWALREEYEESDPFKASIGKTMMRHLYGRLGMQGNVTKQLYKPFMGRNLHKSVYGANWSVRGETLLIESEKECAMPDPFRNVLWAAQITSAVRVRLHQMILAQGNQIVACDTDSVYSMAPFVGLGDCLGDWQFKKHLLSLVAHGPGSIEEQHEDGSWTGKVRGVPPDHALEYLQRGQTEYLQQRTARRVPTGSQDDSLWVPVRKRAYPSILPRTPVHPELLSSGLGWSDTLPPVSATFGE